MQLRKRLSWMAGVALAVLTMGCGEKEAGTGKESGGGSPESKGDTVEAIAEELKGKMFVFAEAARSATDAASAKKAAESLTKLGDEMKAIAERLAKLDVPSEEVRRKLGEDLQKAEEMIEKQMGDAEALWEKLDPAATKALEEGLEAFGMKMQEAMVVFEEYFENEEASE